MGEKLLKPFSIKWIARTAVLLAITLAFQMLGFPQMITGPAVNGMLLLSGVYVGMAGGVIIGLLTPWIAFIRGILPPPLAPMIPFIMLGNAVLVVFYVLFRAKLGKSYISWGAGLVLGSIAKFLILSSAVKFIVNVPPPVAQAMQVPQLFTALIGGVVALLVEKGLNSAFYNISNSSNS